MMGLSINGAFIIYCVNDFVERAKMFDEWWAKKQTKKPTVTLLSWTYCGVIDSCGTN